MTVWWPLLITCLFTIVLASLVNGKPFANGSKLIDDFSADPSWHPPMYLGPGRNEALITKTPKGIRVYTSGFDDKRILAAKGGIHARVVLQVIDRLWIQAKASMCGVNAPLRLSKSEITKVARLPADFPVVMIEQTIWHSKDKKRFVDRESIYGNFLGKPTLIVIACVWYKTVLRRPQMITGWSLILEDEFKQAILVYLGRQDIRLAKK